MNNAAYDYISRCASSDLDLKAPPQDLRIWIFKNLSCSSAAMLHHGAFVESNDLIQRYLGGYSSLLKTFLPDITIGAKAGDGEFVDLYSAVMHEMAHASHYAQVGNSWWNPYITILVGKKQYALNFVLQDPERTLTDAEVEKTMEKILSGFQSEFGAILR